VAIISFSKSTPSNTRVHTIESSHAWFLRECVFYNWGDKCPIGKPSVAVNVDGSGRHSASDVRSAHIVSFFSLSMAVPVIVNQYFSFTKWSAKASTLGNTVPTATFGSAFVTMDYLAHS